MRNSSQGFLFQKNFSAQQQVCFLSILSIRKAKQQLYKLICGEIDACWENTNFSGLSIMKNYENDTILVFINTPRLRFKKENLPIEVSFLYSFTRNIQAPVGHER